MRNVPHPAPIPTIPISDVTICLDTTRIYREAYEQSGIADGLLDEARAEQEADAEFRADTYGGLR